MAVNCYSNLIDPETEITYLVPNQIYTGTILNAFDADYYKYEMFETETMTYNIRVFPQTSDPIDMELRLYKVIGVDLTLVATATLTQFYNTFDFDGSPGEYRFCLTSANHVNYELEVEFTDYPFTLFGDADAYSGEYMPEFDFYQPGAQCDGEVFYTIVEGNLPAGLEFLPAGIIRGTPEELDCETPADYTPSFNFDESAEEYGENARISTSYDFPILVRAALVDDPSVFIDRTFLICIRNNWDYDRDAYLDALTNFEQKVYLTEQPVGDPIPQQAADDESDCPVCDEPTVDTVTPVLTDIERDALCSQCVIAEEHSGLVAINNGSCEVCDDEPEDIVTLPQVEDVEIDGLCTPCDVPVEETGLRPIVLPLCCAQPDEEEDEDTLPELTEGVPNFCLTNFITAMRNEKVCSGPLTCDSKDPVYPVIDVTDTGITIESHCSSTCNI